MDASDKCKGFITKCSNYACLVLKIAKSYIIRHSGCMCLTFSCFSLDLQSVFLPTSLDLRQEAYHRPPALVVPQGRELGWPLIGCVQARACAAVVWSSGQRTGLSVLPVVLQLRPASPPSPCASSLAFEANRPHTRTPKRRSHAQCVSNWVTQSHWYHLLWCETTISPRASGGLGKSHRLRKARPAKEEEEEMEEKEG